MAPWCGLAPGLPGLIYPPDQLGEMPEDKPTAKPADEDAAHFLLRMVHQFPNRVTIYEGGPMTNLALDISIDPEFVLLAKELVFMGGSFNLRILRSRVRQHSNSRVYLLVRSGSGSHCAACAVEEDCLHAGGYFGENEIDF